MELSIFHNEMSCITESEIEDFSLQVENNHYIYINEENDEEYHIIPEWRLSEYIKEWLNIGNIALVTFKITSKALGIHNDALLAMNRHIAFDKLNDILLESIQDRKEEILEKIAVAMIEENELEKYFSCDSSENIVSLLGKGHLTYRVN
jgi:hypothetical protein